MRLVPRGIRNKNPGNIDFNPSNQWVGQLGLEEGVATPRFARFDTHENGIRALAKLLLNYCGKDGLPGVGGPGVDTVWETVSRWAPQRENDTQAYALQVAARLGVQVDAPIDVTGLGTLRALIEAIIEHENGGNPFPSAVVEEGMRRALS